MGFNQSHGCQAQEHNLPFQAHDERPPVMFIASFVLLGSGERVRCRRAKAKRTGESGSSVPPPRRDPSRSIKSSSSDLPIRCSGEESGPDLDGFLSFAGCIVIYIKKTMEGSHGKQESQAASVIKVAREPAIIINGVPELPPDCTSDSQPEVKNNAESQVDPRFGEWLEGRKVKKLFGDTYYVGKVVKYDSESKWYNILYDDGDQEDLEWCELEEVLLPLDVTIPLKTLVLDKCKLQGTGPGSRPKVGRPRKVYATMDVSVMKTSNVVPSRGKDVMSNRISMVGIENNQGQQSNDVPRLLPAPTSSDVTGSQLVAVTAEGNAQTCLQANNQPRKRGRPRKDATLSANNPPKKRGRPPKNRSASGNSQNAGNTSALPVQDGESSGKQNSTLKRNTLTARAEKLKRENLRVQGTPPGTQLF